MSQFFCRAVTLLTFAVTIVVSMSSSEAGLDVGIETRLSQDAAEVFELATEPSGDSTPVEIQQPKEKGLFATEIGPQKGYPIAGACVPPLDNMLNSEKVCELSTASPSFFSLEIEHVPLAIA